LANKRTLKRRNIAPKKRVQKRSVLSAEELRVQKDIDSTLKSLKQLRLKKKDIKKQTRENAKLAKQLATNAERERERAEKELQEFYKSLQPKRKGVRHHGASTKGATQQSVTPKSKALPAGAKTSAGKKKQYTIKELKGNQKKAVVSWLRDEANAQQLTDALLGPGEYIGMEIPNRYTGTDLKVHKGFAKSFALYSDFGKAFKRAANYIEHGTFGNGMSRNDFVNSIRIIKFGDRLPDNATQEQRARQAEQLTSKWSTAVRQESAERKARREKVSAKIEAAEKRAKQAEKRAKKAERELKQFKKKKG
jgi:hypothetical protein